MMKHESIMASSAIPIDMSVAPVTKRRNNDMMRCINDVWRPKSVTIPVQSPKSPITKAFDFLPWSRSKRQQQQIEKQQQQHQQQNDDMCRKDPNHYQKNIFRNGGGIIRDILSDRLNKDRARDSSMGRIEAKHALTQKKSLAAISRNKSLDINELIDSVENDELVTGNAKQEVKNRFMDDTFIENMIRAKSEDDGGRVTEKLSNNCNQNRKHILFNDENVVYLIKKEVPVTKRQGRSPARQDENGRSMSVRTRGNSSPRLSSDVGGGSIVTARLKFKRLSPEVNRRIVSPSTMGSRVAGGNNNPPISPSASAISSVSSSSSSSTASTAVAVADGPSGGGGASNKRGILHRQSTPLPALTQRDNNELYGSQIRRRKSFNDTNFDRNDNSSPSSLGGVASAGALTDERPKSDKPRKKLSFREPIVSPRCVERRQSSPQQFNSNNNNNSSDKSGRVFDNRYAATVNGTSGGGGGGVGAGNGNAFNDPNADSHAMRIVRTVGQAFEVCHKFNLHKNSLDNNEERSDASSDLLDVERTSEQLSDEDLSKKEQIDVTPDTSPPQRPNHLELTPQLNNNNNRKSPCILTDEDKSPSSPSSPSREINKLKDQLEQQAMQTRQALAQLMLVREQLISETNARIEAQARTQQLLQQNRELLEHLASLGAYTDPQATAGLTSANIALAPQSQLQLLFQEPADLSAAVRKAILASANNNNLATINKQINSLGSINQQLTTLSHQLSGLNQQSQNLQNFQNLTATLQQQQQQSLTPPQQQQMSTLHMNTPPVSQQSSSPIPPLTQLQTLSNQFTNISSQGNQQDLLSKELFQMNQELLNRLQALNLGAGSSANTPSGLNGAGALGSSNSPHNSFFYVNPMSCSPNNNNSFNFLSSPSSLGNLTPSPIGTLNRNSYSNSPINEELRLSIDKNLNSLEENHNFMKSLPGSNMAAASNGNLASTSGSGTSGLDNSRSSAEASTSSSPNRTSEPRFNTVMLKVTDESGNVTNQRKLSATPSFITRSTSEKVPNRSQMMSQVQRTAWARHTTK